MKLSETAEGKAWIRRFDFGDQGDATLLLDSLRLISADRFHGEMRRLVTRATNNLGDNIALYAVREVEDEEVYFEQKENAHHLFSRESCSEAEGSMAHIITTLSRSNTKRFLNHPPLKTLKSKKTRHIFLLEDLVGSGNRVVEFLESWRRNSTIVSWCSSHHIQFHLVAYSISEMAEAVIRHKFGKRKGDWPLVNISFTFAKRPSAIEGRWSDSDRQRLVQLCEKYGDRWKIRWGDRLGYRKSMSVLVFAHGCPNNVPGIIWCDTDLGKGVFPNRVVPENLLLTAFSQAVPSVAANLPAIPASTEAGPPLQNNIVRLLGLLRRRVRGTTRLAEILDLTTSECLVLLDTCRQHKLIDCSDVLTDFGRRELLREEREAKVRVAKAAESRPYYVPKQLREARARV